MDSDTSVYGFAHIVSDRLPQSPPMQWGIRTRDRHDRPGTEYGSTHSGHRHQAVLARSVSPGVMSLNTVCLPPPRSFSQAEPDAVAHEPRGPPALPPRAPFPHIAEHMHNIADNSQIDMRGFRQSSEARDVMRIAIDDDNPLFPLVRIAAQRLLKEFPGTTSGDCLRLAQSRLAFGAGRERAGVS